MSGRTGRAGPDDLDGDAGERSKPDGYQQDGRSGAVHRQDERGVGRCNQQIDRRVIETAQPPFDRGDRPQIVGGGETKHRQETGDVDDDRDNLSDIIVVPGHHHKQCRSSNRHHYAKDMDDRIGDSLAAVIFPSERDTHTSSLVVHCGKERAGGSALSERKSRD